MDTYTVEQASPNATDTLGRKTAPRRLRTAEEKLRIVRETQVPGASVAEIARRHAVNANLLLSERLRRGKATVRCAAQREDARPLAGELLPPRPLRGDISASPLGRQ